jgi:hypothetical protein
MITPAPQMTARQTIATLPITNDRCVFGAFNPPAAVAPLSGCASVSPHRGQLVITAT